MMEKTYTNVSLSSHFLGLPTTQKDVLFGKSGFGSSKNWWIKNYENVSGWLFGDVGTFDDTDLKCCNIRKEELLHTLLSLPTKLTSRDRVVIIDGKLFGDDLKILREYTIIMQKLAINHNLTVMTFHEKN